MNYSCHLTPWCGPQLNFNHLYKGRILHLTPACFKITANLSKQDHVFFRNVLWLRDTIFTVNLGYSYPLGRPSTVCLAPVRRPAAQDCRICFSHSWREQRGDSKWAATEITFTCPHISALTRDIHGCRVLKRALPWRSSTRLLSQTSTLLMLIPVLLIYFFSNIFYFFSRKKMH